MNKPFLYIHVPKTAGVSVRDSGLIGEKNKRGHAHARNIKDIKNYFSFCFVRNPYSKFLSSYNYLKTAPPGYSTKHLIGGLKRAEYLNKFYPTFKEFCLGLREGRLNGFDDKHFLDLQKDWVCDKEGNIIVNFIGRFENLSEDWIKVQIKNNVDENKIIDLPWKNRLKESKNIDWSTYGSHKRQFSEHGKLNNKNIDWKNFYDDESADIVYNHKQEDFKMFGYERYSYKSL